VDVDQDVESDEVGGAPVGQQLLVHIQRQVAFAAGGQGWAGGGIMSERQCLSQRGRQAGRGIRQNSGDEGRQHSRRGAEPAQQHWAGSPPPGAAHLHLTQTLMSAE
jgi:hypothetical protein